MTLVERTTCLMSRIVRYKKKINKKIYSSKARGDVVKETDGLENQAMIMAINPIIKLKASSVFEAARLIPEITIKVNSKSRRNKPKPK